ncbi:hypothetical protein Efla_005763 [Eimeria flavescens]
MEGAGLTPPSPVRRRGRLRKRLVSDEEEAERPGVSGDAAAEEPSVRPSECSSPRSPPPADRSKNAAGSKGSSQPEGLGLAAERTPPQPRRLRRKSKTLKESSSARSSSSSNSSRSSESSPPRNGTQGSQRQPAAARRRRDRSADSFSSPSSDADEQGTAEGASNQTSEENPSSGDEESRSDSEVAQRRHSAWWGAADLGSEAQFREALDWCLDRILKEGQAIQTEASAEQREYEVALWDDELTRGGTRHFVDAFFCEPSRPLGAQLLPATTAEEKAVVFLDFPNELYKAEFLHLRVVEPRTRRVVLANLLKCAADQHAACREFDSWMEKNKRFFITQEERLNKLFHLRVAEPRGLRKLQHLLLRAEQCGLVERSKSMGYRRASPSQNETKKPFEGRGPLTRPAERIFCEGPASGSLLFGADDSQYSQDDFSGDDSHSRAWNESSTRGWAALKRSGASRSSLSHSGFDAALQETLRARAKEEQKRRQEHRDAEKKQARHAALLQRWSDVQRLARTTHDGPRFHHPSREEHAKAQRFACRGFSFARSDVVYIRPPQELLGKNREAVDAYLRQLPRMHKLLAEPHKLVLASKYGLVSVTESADLTSAPILERNADPWLQQDAAAHWEELKSVFGYAPWDVLAAGGGFIPPSLAERLQQKAAVAAKKQQESSGGSSRTTPVRAAREAADSAKPHGEAAAATPQRSGGRQEEGGRGDVCSAPSTPAKSAAARQHSQSSASPRMTPASSSRLRRGRPARTPPSQPENGDLGVPRAAESPASVSKEAEGDAQSKRMESSSSSARKQAATPCKLAEREEPAGHTEWEEKDAGSLEPQKQSAEKPLSEALGSGPLAAAAEDTAEGPMDAEEPQKTETTKAQSPRKIAAAGCQRLGQKPQSSCSKVTYEGPRQMKLTDLLRFTLNKVKGKVAIAINSEALRVPLPEEAESDEDFTFKWPRSKRRLVDEEAPLIAANAPGQQQPAAGNSAAEAAKADEDSATEAREARDPSAEQEEQTREEQTTANESSNVSQPTDEEEGRRQEKRRQKQQRRKEREEAARRQRRLERKKQMREILRQMMEYEAEENDEELRDDAEYAAALEELKHRLAREGEEEDEEVDDSDEEFLEDLIAKPEDADEDERNEDRAAMTMKLQRDLGEREEEVYERLIGRYQRNAKEGGNELTEQELLELELEERRRNEAKRRKLLGDGVLAGLDIDDWLSDSEMSAAESASGEEEEAEEDAEDHLIKWSTIALEGSANSVAPVASSAAATPADLAAKCQENATRRQRIQQLLDMRKKNARSAEGGRGPSGESTGNSERMQQQGTAAIRRTHSHHAKESDSEDEMKSLYKTAPKLQAKRAVLLTNAASLRGPSCIRFNPNQQQDLELSSSSRQAGSQHKPSCIQGAAVSKPRYAAPPASPPMWPDIHLLSAVCSSQPPCRLRIRRLSLDGFAQTQDGDPQATA